MADDIRSDIIINIDTSVGIAEIKNLQRQISQLNTQLLQSGAAQARNAQNIQKDLIKNINSTGKFAAEIKNISTTAESFTTALERNKLSMGEYFRYAGASTKTFGRLFKSEFDTIEKVARERVKTLQTQYIKLGRDGSGAMKAIAVRPLILDMDSLATKTAMAAQKQQLLNQLLKQGSTNLLNFGKNTQWAGRQLMVGFTIPLAYMGAAAAREFRKIEEQAIRFKRVYGDAFSTSAETEKALDSMKKLADEFTKYGIEVNKTLELAADVAQMGLKGAELRAQVTEATRLAVLGEVEQQEAMAATISVTNAFGTAAEDLAEKINFLNAVENETVTAIQDLTIAIPKAGPVVKQLGGDVEDLAFFLTAMKEGGINASEGANALKSGLAALINPTDKASQMLQGLGINIRGIVEANKGNVTGVVVDFARALDTLDPLNRARAIEQLFGKFQFSRLSTLFQNVIKEGSQASKVLKLASNGAAQLAIIAERELKRVEESPLFKFQKQLEKFQAALAPLGEQFLKAVTPILEFGTSILKNFNNMSEGAKQFAVVATTVVAGIGPVFLMMFGLIANGAANIIKLFANLFRIFTGVGKGSKDLGLSTEYMTQQQLEAAAVAASLDQTHSKLIQTFSAETVAVNKLADSYSKAIVSQSKFLGVDPATGLPVGKPLRRQRPARKLAKGIVSVPGPKGAGDIVPAMLSPGEAVIPAKQSQKYAGLIDGMINDNLPGYRFGRNPFSGLMKKVKPEGANYNLLEGIIRLMTGTRTGPSDIYTDKIAKKFIRSRPNIAVRIPANKFIELAQSKDKRYKSVFETGFSQAGDTAFKRAAAEEKLFNLPIDADPRLRPVYGYLFKNEREMNLKSKKGKDGQWKPTRFSEAIFEKLTGKKVPLATSKASQKQITFGRTGTLFNPKTYMYGNVAMVLKKRAIKDRATFTYGDSYNSWAQRYATPAPLGTQSAKKIKASYTSRDKSFFEAQILGGFTLRDVKRIIVSEPALIPQLQSVLRANGLDIPVRMPRFTMLQRLQKLVYGNRIIPERLPFTAKYGPKAGKYTNPPIKVGNRKIWLNSGITKIPEGMFNNIDTPSTYELDQQRTLQAAHASTPGRTFVYTGSSDSQMREITAFIDNLLRENGLAGTARGESLRNKLLGEAMASTPGELLRFYGQKVEILPSFLNPANPITPYPIDQWINGIADMPQNLYGSGIVARLNDINQNLSAPELRKYLAELKANVLSELNGRKAKGTADLNEEQYQAIFEEVERRTIRGQSPAVRRKIEIANENAEFNLSIGRRKPEEAETSLAEAKKAISGFSRTDKSGQDKARRLIETGVDSEGNMKPSLLAKAVDDPDLDENIRKKYYPTTRLSMVSKPIKDAFLEYRKTLSSEDRKRLEDRLVFAAKENLDKKRIKTISREIALKKAKSLFPGQFDEYMFDSSKGRFFTLEEGKRKQVGVPAVVNQIAKELEPRVTGNIQRKILRRVVKDLDLPIDLGLLKAAPLFAKPVAVKQSQIDEILPKPRPRKPKQPETIQQQEIDLSDILKVGETKQEQERAAKAAASSKGRSLFKFGKARSSGLGMLIALAASLAMSGSSFKVPGFKNGVFSVPGPRGAGDVVPAMLSPGESVIPARQSAKYAPLVQAMINDSVPGYARGRIDPELEAAVDAAAMKELNIKRDSKGNLVYKNNRAINEKTKQEFELLKQNKDLIKEQRSLLKDQKNAQKKQSGMGRGMGMMAAGGLISSLGMVGAFNQDPQAQLIGNIAIAGGGLLSVLGFLPGKIIGIGVALTAITAGIIYFTERLNQATKAGIETANAMTLTKEKLVSLAEFTGEISSTELADKRRSDLLSSMTELDRKFGMSFMESDIGKSFIEDVNKQVKSGKSMGEIARNLGLQFADSIAQGVLTTDQAASIAAALSAQFKDFTFGAKINATITELLGPGGEDLTKDPLRVMIRIQAESMAQVRSQIESAEAGQVSPLLENYEGAQLNPATQIGAGVVGAGASAGLLALSSLGLANIWNPAGWAALALSVGLIAKGAWEATEAQAKNNELRSIAITRAGQEMALNNSRADSLRSQFDLLIEEEQKIKDIAQSNLNTATTEQQRAKYQQEIINAESKISALKDRQSKALTDFNTQSAKQYNDLTNYLTELRKQDTQNQFMNPFATSQLDEVLKKGIEERYKEDPLGLEKAKQNLEEIKQIEDDGFKSTLQLAVVSGTMSVSTIETLIKLGKSNKPLQAKFNLLISQQGTTGLDTLTQLMNQVGVGEVGFDAIFGSFLGKSGAEFDKRLSALSALSGVEAFGFDINLDENGVQKLNNVLDAITDLEKIEDPLTKETVIDLQKKNPGVYDALLADWNRIAGADGTITKTVQINYVATAQSVDAVKSYLTSISAQNTPAGRQAAVDLETYARMPKDQGDKWLLSKYGPSAAAFFTPSNAGGTSTNEQGEGGPGDTGGGQKPNPLTAIFERVKAIRNASISTSGDIDTLIKRLKPLMDAGSATSTFFRGTEQKLLLKGYGKEFIDTVMSMDEATRARFVTIKNGIVKVTEEGKNLNAVLGELALGDLQSGMISGVQEINMQIKAMEQLVAAGMPVEQAFEITSDATVANSIVTRKNSAEIANLVYWQNRLTEANKQRLKSTPQGMQEFLQGELNKVLGGLDLVNKVFQAREAMVESNFARQIDPYNRLIASAEYDIANMQDQVDDFNYQLTLIEDQESKINEEYDKKLEALEQIEKANDSIANQQKSQLSLADALSRGDIAAAAKAVQEIREQQATKRTQDAREMLEQQRQKRLESAAVTVNGKLLTRKQIEEQLKTLQQDIAKIEEERLEPNIKIVRELERQKTLALEAVGDEGYLGKTRKEWERIAVEASLATVESEAFKNSLIGILSTLKGFKFENGKFVGFDPTAFASEFVGGQNFVPGSENTNKTPDDTGQTVTTGRSRKEIFEDLEKLGLTIKNAQDYLKRMQEAGKTKEAAGALEKLNKYLAQKDRLIAEYNAAPRTPTGTNVAGSAGTNKPDTTTTKDGQNQIPPRPSTDAGYGKTWQLVNNEWVAVTSPKPPYAAPTGKEYVWDTVSDSWKLVPKPTTFVNQTPEKPQTGYVSVGGYTFTTTPTKPFTTAFYSNGGRVFGSGTSTSDSIPAMLSNGEYVVRASSVKKLGIDFLDFINASGKLPGFAAGGSIRDRIAAAKKADTKIIEKAVAQAASKSKTAEPKPKPGDPAFSAYMPSGPADAIGKGMQLVMDNVQKALFGQAYVNAKYGVENTVEDVLDSAMTVALNALPVPAGSAAVSGAVRQTIKKDIVDTIDKQIATSVVKAVLKNPSATIGMTPAGLRGVVQDKKVKNFFEVLEENKQIIREAEYGNARLRAEQKLFGIPENAPSSARPTYAALSTPFKLPYTLAKNIPGTTGSALRLFDPRFNRTTEKYMYGSGFPGLATLRPGFKGTYTISDSFRNPDKVFTIGAKGDIPTAARDIVSQLSIKDSPLTSTGIYALPYIEAQISAATNPFNFIKKIELPIREHTMKYRNNGITQTVGGRPRAQSAAMDLQRMLAENNVKSIKTGVFQDITPKWAWNLRQVNAQISKQKANFRGSRAGILLRGLSEGVKQKQSKIVKKLFPKKFQNQYTMDGLLRKALWADNALAMGGLVKSKYYGKGGAVPGYRMGGLLPYKSEGGSIFKPLGTDTVPAMLTPGEFVVRKYAVDNFGVDKLKAINSGTYSGDSVYNYDVSINVQTDANPDQIARAVIGQIRQIESQRIRGNRF